MCTPTLSDKGCSFCHGLCLRVQVLDESSHHVSVRCKDDGPTVRKSSEMAQNDLRVQFRSANELQDALAPQLILQQVQKPKAHRNRWRRRVNTRENNLKELGRLWMNLLCLQILVQHPHHRCEFSRISHGGLGLRHIAVRWTGKNINKIAVVESSSNSSTPEQTFRLNSCGSCALHTSSAG